MENVQPIESETEYKLALKELSSRARPPFFLRLLMGGIEKYRQARKIGWSRRQNKYGVTTFHSFELDLHADATLFDAVQPLVAEAFPDLPADPAAFLSSLLKAPDLKAFLFVHDVRVDSEQFEGATLSLGRVVEDAPRHRHRADIVVEAAVKDGALTSELRTRLYVDPFRKPIEGNTGLERIRRGRVPSAVALLDAASLHYRQYVADPAKAWKHWTQDYIDYFGPRQAAVRGTRFPTAVDRVARFEAGRNVRGEVSASSSG